MVDKMTFNIEKLTETRIRVEVGISGATLGILYFEKPKLGWTNKPILPTKWACVDASVQGLYVYNKDGGESFTPKEIISHCQDLISNL
jgi:hypothetical protein